MTTPTPDLTVSVRRLVFIRQPGRIIAHLETEDDIPDDKIAEVFRLALGVTTPTPPTMGAELPPLPEGGCASEYMHNVRVFSEREIREYALAAIAADRQSASRATPEGFWLAPIRADDSMTAAVLGKWCFDDATHAEVRAAFAAMRDSWLSRHPAAPALTANQAAEAPPVANIGWRDRAYVDSTPQLHVGDSAFEDWFQAQPFATQSGVKQISRDSYAAGMGDPLVMARVDPPVAVEATKAVARGMESAPFIPGQPEQTR